MHQRPLNLRDDHDQAGVVFQLEVDVLADCGPEPLVGEGEDAAPDLAITESAFRPAGFNLSVFEEDGIVGP